MFLTPTRRTEFPKQHELRPPTLSNSAAITTPVATPTRARNWQYWLVNSHQYHDREAQEACSTGTCIAIPGEVSYRRRPHRRTQTAVELGDVFQVRKKSKRPLNQRLSWMIS
jgi:hypothetical protein